MNKHFSLLIIALHSTKYPEKTQGSLLFFNAFVTFSCYNLQYILLGLREAQTIIQQVMLKKRVFFITTKKSRKVGCATYSDS